MKSPVLGDDDVLRILRDRERQGTLFFLRAHLGVVCLLLILIPILRDRAQDARGLLSMLAVPALLAGLLVGLTTWVRRGGSTLAAALLVLAGDVVALTLIPFVWWRMAGGAAAVPASYLLKSSLGALVMCLPVVAAMPIRPVLPVAATAGLYASEGLLLVLALRDPGSEIGSSFYRGIMGPQLNWQTVVYQWIYLAVEAGLLALLTHRMRLALIDGVRTEKASGQLARYFSPEIARKIQGESSDFLRPGGTLQPAAVLFADIRDFTTLSESMPPAQLIALLTDYQERMVRAIFAHGGTLDKFIGDGIMATFGTPTQRPDDAERAVRAGLAMKGELARLNDERQRIGLPPLRQGIGIHVGDVIAGNIGSADRLEYTVIGDAVNTASRIESACKELGADFLISAAVRDRLSGELQARLAPAGAVQLKGKAVAVSIYKLVP